jgi:serpin B
MLEKSMRVIAGGKEPERGLAAAANSPETRALVASTTAFSAALYAKAAHGSDNLFFSPGSVSVGLAMAYAAAKGETAAEMKRALGVGALDPAQLHATFALLAAAIADAPGVESVLANALFAQSGYRLHPEFTALLRTQYGTGLREIDFAGPADAARQTINAWVADQTAGKIVELLPRGTIATLTGLVLVTALSFKGRWASLFPEANTSQQPFVRLGGQPSLLPLMHRTGSHKLVDVDVAQLLSIPYEGRATSMVVILPHEREGLWDVEGKLVSDLGNWIERLEGAPAGAVAVHLPRFTLETSLDLRQAVQLLGVRCAFDRARADFSGMTGHRDFWISAVRHKACVEVTEHGAVAPAAAIGAAAVTDLPKPRTFRADHPFLFLIIDTRTRCPLFMGRFAHPV